MLSSESELLARRLAAVEAENRLLKMGGRAVCKSGSSRAEIAMNSPGKTRTKLVSLFI
jgi:hypothetical protein